MLNSKATNLVWKSKDLSSLQFHTIFYYVK